MMTILYDPAPGGGGGGGAASWIDALPDDLKGSPSLKTIPDVPTLAKNYVEQGKLIGTKRLPEPQATWKPEEWSAFYNQLGRPDAPEKYTLPAPPRGMESAVDEAMLVEARKHLHGLGLTGKQFTGALEFYYKHLESSAGKSVDAEKASRAEGENTLRREFGTKYDAKVDLAQSVIRKFGSETLTTFLNEKGLGNHPEVVRLFAKIGEAITEDSAGRAGSGLVIGGATAALGEIEKLKTDPEFITALSVRENPGHKAAVERWEQLHRMAHPE